MHVYMHVYVSLSCMPPVSLCEALLDKQRAFLEKARSFNAKFAYCEKCQWKLKYFWSFRSLRKFTDKTTVCYGTCMIVSYQKVGKKIETVAWTLYFNKIVFICWILHVMFTLKLMAVNKSLWQRIIILQVFLVLFKRNNPLWLHIDSQLILRIVN